MSTEQPAALSTAAQPDSAEQPAMASQAAPEAHRACMREGDYIIIDENGGDKCALGIVKKNGCACAVRPPLAVIPCANQEYKRSPRYALISCGIASSQSRPSLGPCGVSGMLP